MKTSHQKKHAKNFIKDIDQKIRDEGKHPNIEFGQSLVCSIKSLAMKKNEIVKSTTRLFTGKMIMFAEILLESFTYDLRETFFFPGKKTREIYEKYMTERTFPFSVLTNTDRICIFYIFICKPESSLQDSKFRDILFEVIKENKILHRFYTSHKFWEKFSVRDKSLKKKFGYYSIENIDDPCLVTVAVNLREYLETFESVKINKKHKGLRKGARGMEFENYSEKINSVQEIETFGQLTQDKQKQNRFSVKSNEMMLEELKNQNLHK